MEDQECTQIFERLSGALRQVGLEWVVDQVDLEIRLGKVVQREVETLRGIRSTGRFAESNPLDFSSHLKRGPRATFPVTEAYGSPERLRLLLDAIDQAIVNTAEMEREIFRLLDSPTGILEAVTFSPEEGEAESVRMVLQQSRSRHEAANRLRELIDAIRREI